MLDKVAFTGRVHVEPLSDDAGNLRRDSTVEAK
jgi:hypothetical protein